MRQQHLDRNEAIEPRVARLVDFSHPARAEQRQDFVGAKTRATGERHRPIISESHQMIFTRTASVAGLACLPAAEARRHSLNRSSTSLLEVAVVILRRTLPANHPLVVSTTRDLQQARQ